MLSITREEFRRIYKGTSVIKDEDLFYSEPQSDKEYIDKYLCSKLWRLNNLYTIVTKHAGRIIMVMNKSQHKVYAAYLKHPRLCILKSRQQGVSTFWLVDFFDDCIFLKDIKSGLMAQGDTEAKELLVKVKVLWDELPQSIKDFMGVDLEKNNTTQFSLNNGSSIHIGTSFRSGTLHRLHISEYGKIANTNPKRAEETRTGSMQAIAPGNPIIIESTAEGDNAYKKMWDKCSLYAGTMSELDFMPVFLSWIEDPNCVISQLQEPDATLVKYFLDIEAEQDIKLTQEQKNFYIAKHRELGDETPQEYPSNPEEAFLKNRKGTYYANLYVRLIKRRDREIPNLYDPNLPVQVAMDIGFNELHVLNFFQTHSDGWRIINEYKNSQHEIKHYCEVMDDIQEELGYDITHVVLPHDGGATSMNDGLTIEDLVWEYGYTQTTLLERTQSIITDRELVKKAMETMYIDPLTCPYLVSCWMNYTKTYDEKREIWRDVHFPDIHAHGADTFRYMVIGGIIHIMRINPSMNRHSNYIGMDV